jgi:hypothetical protein
MVWDPSGGAGEPVPSHHLRLVTMSDREIRAMLRAATAARILHGWQGPHLRERSYCIAPADSDPMELPPST